MAAACTTKPCPPRPLFAASANDSHGLPSHGFRRGSPVMLATPHPTLAAPRAACSAAAPLASDQAREQGRDELGRLVLALGEDRDTGPREDRLEALHRYGPG